MKKKIKIFWENRSQKKFFAGSNDADIDIFETNYIASQMNKNKSIFDVGCGNGLLLKRLLVKKKYKNAIGVDFSKGMIKSAKKLRLKNTIFKVADITQKKDLSEINKKFDIIITKRSVIIIKKQSEQLKILDYLGNFLKRDGKILCCENSKDALDKINKIRLSEKLPKIKQPWHNTYFEDKKIKRYKFRNIKFVKFHEFTSTYYFISRIINALWAKNEKEKIFNKSINKLGMSLNQRLIPGFSQNKIYEFSKRY